MLVLGPASISSELQVGSVNPKRLQCFACPWQAASHSAAIESHEQQGWRGGLCELFYPLTQQMPYLR